MKKLPYFIAIIFAFVVVLGCYITKLKVDEINKNDEKPTYSTVLTLWHLDLLEGGKGSRSSFLKDTAVRFKQKNSQVNVIVQVHSKYSCEENFKKGIYPDMISYSYGLDGVESLFKKLNFDSDNGVTIGKKLYALPFALGGYVLISKGEKVERSGKKLYVSQNDTNMPMISYYLEDLNFEIVVNNRPIDAYTNFLAEKDAMLLGTQRDLYRLNKRGVKFSFEQLDKFSDLKYFISVLSDDKYTQCVKFIKLLTSDMQPKVENLGLVSISENQNDEILKSLSKVRKAQTLYGYPTYKTIKTVNDELYSLNKSKEEKLNTIKNLLK